MSHIQGTLTASGFAIEAVIDGRKTMLAHLGVSGDRWIPPGVQEANARRIVACWNACAGLSTEDLERRQGWSAVGIATADSLREQTASLQAQLDERSTENANLRDALADKVSATTMLRDLHVKNGGLSAHVEGGACRIFAEAFADQFKELGGINYVEAQFSTNGVGGLIVTMQRVEGKTPHHLRKEAEAQRDALASALRQCAKKFRAYEDHHRANGSFEKAESNAAYAEMAEFSLMEHSAEAIGEDGPGSVAEAATNTQSPGRGSQAGTPAAIDDGMGGNPAPSQREASREES